jgi:hypothetical protein
VSYEAVDHDNPHLPLLYHLAGFVHEEGLMIAAVGPSVHHVLQHLLMWEVEALSYGYEPLRPEGAFSVYV